MNIIVDADACPAVIKEILFKAATRTQVPLLLVANHFMRVPNNNVISFLHVDSGFDKADDEIVNRAEQGDLVITSDIPLAAELVPRKVMVLSPRGELYDSSNIRARLQTRDFMETMRASGVQTGGPAALGMKERREFANQLDRILAQNAK